MPVDDFDAEAWRDKGRKAADTIGFKLPTGITMRRGPASAGVAFYFRHHELGDLGRVRLVDDGAGARLLGEVAGEPEDPMTARRAELMAPLVGQVHHLLDEVAGGPHRASKAAAKPHDFLQERADDLLVKVMRCDHCDAPVARLVFAPPEAHTVADFEDVARRAYQICAELPLPTWIVGPGKVEDILVQDDPMNVRSTVMKIWPERGQRFESSPALFNQTVHELQRSHCHAPGN